MARLRHPSPTPETTSAEPDTFARDDPGIDPARTPTGPVPAQAAAPAGGRANTRTRTSTAYAGVAGAVVLLVLVLVFVVQNLHDTSVHFFTADARLPAGVVILIAAVAGGVLVLLASAARVLQLRRMARRRD